MVKWKAKTFQSTGICIDDILNYADHSHVQIYHLLVLYDVTSLSVNEPVQETIAILVDEAFTDDRFNDTYNLKLEKD